MSALTTPVAIEILIDEMCDRLTNYQHEACECPGEYAVRKWLAQVQREAAEPHLRRKWAEEWGVGDETSRPLYYARLRIGELEGEVHYKDREIRRLDFELNIALGFLKGDGE